MQTLDEFKEKLKDRFHSALPLIDWSKHTVLLIQQNTIFKPAFLTIKNIRKAAEKGLEIQLCETVSPNASTGTSCEKVLVRLDKVVLDPEKIQYIEAGNRICEAAWPTKTS